MYRESLRTLALFYIRLYRVLNLSAIEDTYIKDTAGRSVERPSSFRGARSLFLPGRPPGFRPIVYSLPFKCFRSLARPR
jgi:hypothetical protein